MGSKKELSGLIFMYRRIVLNISYVISLRNAADAGSRLVSVSGCLFYYIRRADTRRMYVVLPGPHVRKTD